MLDASWQRWQFEVHGVQSVSDEKLQTLGSRFSPPEDIARSGALHWRFADGDANIVIDRLNVQYHSDALRVKVGRQPISLASSFYFTPNDFFAPFAAQAFFRTYKPGVDAARLDWQWSPASQLSLISVLSYPQKPLSNVRANTPDWAKTAYLARLSTLSEYFEWAALLGKIEGDVIIGFDLQGEMFEWLGVKAEGHMSLPEHSQFERDTQVAIAVDHRWANSLIGRIEYFYQRAGADDSADYAPFGQVQANKRYLAKQYTAIGASYEVSPLLLVDGVWLYNLTDASSLLALYSTYSLSDESELSLGLSLPIGEHANNGVLKTEFGNYPQSVTMEYRLYF